MNVINPEVYWIDNRCYRRNPSKTSLPTISTQKFWSTKEDPRQSQTSNYNNSANNGRDRGGGSNDSNWRSGARNTTTSNGASNSSTQLKPYIEEDDYSCDPDAPDDSEDDGFVIESTGNGGFRTKCDDIPGQLFAVVIGAKGSTKARIERDTATRITVPRQNVKGFIEIEGRTAKGVIKARRTINLLTSQTRFRNDATHFPCFPLNYPNIVERVKEFKEAATSAGADPGYFIDAEKVHLTICVVTLFTEEERKKAAEILEIGQKEILEQLGHKGKKIRAHIKGLEIMNDDPTRVDILYAKCVELGEGNILQQMADFLAKKLVASGLAKPNRTDHVKLHCTIMNSLKKAEQLAQSNENNGSDNNGGRSNNSKSRVSRPTFDASVILNEFKDYDFGQVEITEIKLATRFTAGPDGFYKSYRSIPL